MKSLIIEATQPFTIIRFEAEAVRNSFGILQANELDVILKSKPKAILFYSGVANVFCSGGNLKDYASKTRAQCSTTNKKIRNVLSKLSTVGVPTVAVVDGDVLGGGIEVVSTFDHVIATPKSLFGFWQRKIALSYGWGGGERLLRRMTWQNLKVKSLSTEMFDAYEGHRIGLVDQVVPSHLALSNATDWILKQLNLPNESFLLLKNFTPKYETKDFEKVWGNASHKKVLKNFVKRSKNK
jgi:enoyl-CoA hydratase/carnithine racemase